MNQIKKVSLIFFSIAAICFTLSGNASSMCIYRDGPTNRTDSVAFTCGLFCFHNFVFEVGEVSNCHAGEGGRIHLNAEVTSDLANSVVHLRDFGVDPDCDVSPRGFINFRCDTEPCQVTSRDSGTNCFNSK